MIVFRNSDITQLVYRARTMSMPTLVITNRFIAAADLLRQVDAT